MKRTLGIILVLALASGMATNATAKSERKNKPQSRYVTETLAALGEEHSPEKMKIKSVASVEVGDTYYHIYEGKLDDYGFRIIIFDNKQNYLGYYKSDYRPCNYEIESSIVIDSGDVNEDGDQLYFPIPIDVKKGLPDKVQIGAAPTRLVKPPKVEGQEAAPVVTSAEGIVPEYREWTITMKGKELTVRAIYVSQTFGKVTLKSEARGLVNEFAITALSKADREYVEQFK